jgi:hypothetical protein
MGSMKKAFFGLLVIVVGFASTGCIKSSTETTVKPDGSITVKYTVSYLTHVYAKMKSAPDDCTCWKVYQIHSSTVPAARRALDSFEAGFDGSRVKDVWTKLGFEVTKSSVAQREDWRVLEVEATAASLADLNKKLADGLKTMGKDEYLTMYPWYLHTKRLLPKVPRFYKTADPNVVKVQIPMGEVGSELADLGDLNDERRRMVSGQLTYMRTMKSFNEGELRNVVKLPGTIVSVENAKQEGADTVVSDLKGPDLNADAISGQSKQRGVITVMLKIDPATFKIPLEN